MKAYLYYDESGEDPDWVLRELDDDGHVVEDHILDHRGHIPEDDLDVAVALATRLLGRGNLQVERTVETTGDVIYVLSPAEGPTELTYPKRIQTVGNSLCVLVDRSVADALGVDRGDWVEITIRRVE